MQIALSSAGTFALISAGGVISRSLTATFTAASFIASKSRAYVSVSHSTVPSENTSLRRSPAPPVTCSGAE